MGQRRHFPKLIPSVFCALVATSVLSACGTQNSSSSSSNTNSTQSSATNTTTPSTASTSNTSNSTTATSTNSTTANTSNVSASNTDNSATASNGPIKQTKPLVVYANDFDTVIGPMFKKATGYDIKVVHGGGGKILSQVQAEQGNPQWDVVWMDGQASIQQLADKGFFQTGWQPNDLSNLTSEGQSLVPANDAYFPTDLHAAAVIAYNTKAVKASDVPQTWQQLFSYKGKIGMADPGVAAPAYPVVSWLFNKYGIQHEESVFSNLYKQNQLNVYPKNGPLGSALVNGDIQVAALQESNAYELQQKGDPVGIVWPQEGAPGSVRVVTIRKDDPNMQVAQKFVEFVLNPTTQQQLADLKNDSDSFFTPLLKGVNPRPDRKQNPSITEPPVTWAASHETEIKTWFVNQSAQ